MRDGDIDYSRYTLGELEEALAGINQHQFPKNHANLRAAYELKSRLPTGLHADPPVAIDSFEGRRPQPRHIETEREKLARRGLYCLVTGVGAFFAYFNSIYRWVATPEYHRTKGASLRPFMPALTPYLSQIVIALGVGLLGYAAYCLYRYRALSKSGV